MNTFIQCNTTARQQSEGVLHGTEDISRTWKCKGHRTEFAKELVPLFDTSTLLGYRNAGKNLSKTLYAVTGKVDSHIDGIDDPTEDKLDGTPGAITLAEFFE